MRTTANPSLHRRRFTDLQSRFSQHSTAEHDFANLVLARIAGGVLRYSDRCQLLGMGEKMGMNRFEANLLIAMALHRAGERVGTFERSRSRWPLFAAAVVMQGLILGGFYWMLH